jgi:hypothetical protein
MHPTIRKQTKADLLEALRERYRQAPKADKTKVLDEFVASWTRQPRLTGQDGPGPRSPPPPAKGVAGAVPLP